MRSVGEAPEAELGNGLAVLVLEAGEDEPREALDELASEYGGVPLVADDTTAFRWAFVATAGAVAAALGMQRHAARTSPFRRRVIVRVADGRVWPLIEPEEAGAAVDLRHRVGNLPEPATSFIGREAEIASCIELVSEHRLITLTGSGGCGKTRLALEVASQTAALFEAGASWVELAPVSDVSALPLVVGRALDLWLDGAPDPLAALTAGLGARRLLVVLDNCEHLLGACRSLLTRLLVDCPGVHVLATSREPIDLAAERAFRVPSLGLPRNREPIEDSEAGRLFVDRARAVRRNFRVAEDNAADIAAVCQRLDGIPLAIELAAARARLLSPQEIAAGLIEGFHLLGAAEAQLPRQQTLEASVAWSYQLCSDPERRLLRRLAVFSGGFTLEAAEDICDAPPLDRAAVLDTLDRLIDRSMVSLDDGGSERRYRLLETVRVFAHQRLVESGEHDGLRDRHLVGFTALAERADRAIPRTAGLSWLPRLEDDYSNLLSALAWALARRRPEMLLRLAGSLALFWEMRGRFLDGGRWLDLALEAGEGLGDELLPARLRATWGRAHLAVFSVDMETALRIAPPAVQAADRSGDGVSAARLRNTLAVALCYSDPAAARRMLEESVEIGMAAGDDWSVADSTKFTTVTHLMSGDLPGFEISLSKLREVATRLGNSFFLGWCDGGRGYCRMLQGRLPEAIEDFDRSIAVAAQVGDPATRGLVEGWRAYALACLGRLDESRSQAVNCLERTVRQGGALGAPFAEAALAVADLMEGEVDAGLERLAPVARATREGGDTLSALWVVPIYGLALAGAAHLDGALEVLEDARALAAAPIDNPWATAKALHGRGLVEAARGEVVEAENLLHQALAFQHGAGFIPDAVASLDALASCAVKGSGHPEAARLLGAVDAERQRLGLVRSFAEGVAREGAEAEAAAVIGRQAFDSARAEGFALTFDEAVAYATRARGTRGRPVRGWESLTPTEARVVACVSEGLTNPQIAARLFMSRPTVKTHLTHVFAKLGTSTRSELAAEAVRHSGPRRANI